MEIGPKDAIFLILHRVDLENRPKMQQFYVAVEMLAKAGGVPRHQLMFDGYNQDPRRIYQIPEAVAVCQRIMMETPSFIKVVGNDTLATLLMCTAVKKDDKWVPNPAWATVMPDVDKYELGRMFD